MRARRREAEGRSFEEFAKRVKASLISASVAALMLFSFATADWRGAFSLAGGAVAAGARRLGGYNELVLGFAQGKGDEMAGLPWCDLMASQALRWGLG